MPAWVYILASRPYGTLYTGVTTELEKRIYEHRSGEIAGFTSTYGVKSLVWYEEYSEVESAIVQEKRIKRWHRQWKFELIEKMNPKWQDSYGDLNR